MVRAAARARRVAGDGDPLRNFLGRERVLPGPSVSLCREEAGRIPVWSRMARVAVTPPPPPSPACMQYAALPRRHAACSVPAPLRRPVYAPLRVSGRAVSAQPAARS